LRAGADAGPLLKTVDYRHPKLRAFATPLRLEAGDGLRWTCSYHNASDTMVTFGITSNDEMCFAIGAFYLDDDAAPLPPVPGCYGGDVGLTCPWS
jgi:Copper type II ascorbate-dependent monooxygenase, C-terminal domain